MAQPLLVTAAIIRKENEILLVKRGKDPYKDQWGFPGGVGGWEHTSDPYEAVQAEVRGDVGCHFYGNFFTTNYVNGEKPTLTLFYRGEIHGEPTPICQHVLEARYFSIREVKKMDLAFDHNYMLDRYLTWYL